MSFVSIHLQYKTYNVCGLFVRILSFETNFHKSEMFDIVRFVAVHKLAALQKSLVSPECTLTNITKKHVLTAVMKDVRINGLAKSHSSKEIIVNRCAYSNAQGGICITSGCFSSYYVIWISYNRNTKFWKFVQQ
ncbi:unnamed protein product, partial [Trichogramma brassicae]